MHDYTILYTLSVLCALLYIPTKKTQSLKTEPRIKKKNNTGYILFKVHVWKWPVVKDRHIKMKPRIYVLFVFDLDGECKAALT